MNLAKFSYALFLFLAVHSALTRQQTTDIYSTFSLSLRKELSITFLKAEKKLEFLLEKKDEISLKKIDLEVKTNKDFGRKSNFKNIWKSKTDFFHDPEILKDVNKILKNEESGLVLYPINRYFDKLREFQAWLHEECVENQLIIFCMTYALKIDDIIFGSKIKMTNNVPINHFHFPNVISLEKLNFRQFRHIENKKVETHESDLDIILPIEKLQIKIEDKISDNIFKIKQKTQKSILNFEKIKKEELIPFLKNKMTILTSATKNHAQNENEISFIHSSSKISTCKKQRPSSKEILKRKLKNSKSLPIKMSILTNFESKNFEKNDSIQQNISDLNLNKNIKEKLFKKSKKIIFVQVLACAGCKKDDYLQEYFRFENEKSN